MARKAKTPPIDDQQTPAPAAPPVAPPEPSNSPADDTAELFTDSAPEFVEPAPRRVARLRPIKPAEPRPRPARPAFDEYEDGNEQPNKDDVATAEEADAVTALLDSLAGQPSAVIEVYRIRQPDGREERIGGFSPDSLDLDAIQARYGAGAYRFRARVPGGRMLGGARTVHLAEPFTINRAPAQAAAAQPAADPLAELARQVRELSERINRPAQTLGLEAFMPLLTAAISRPPDITLKDMLALVAKNDSRSSVSELIGAVKEIRELAALEAPAAGGDSLGQIVGAFAPMFAAGVQQHQQQAQQQQPQQQAARPALAPAPAARPIQPAAAPQQPQQPAPQPQATAAAPDVGGQFVAALGDLAPVLARAAKIGAETDAYAAMVFDTLEAEGLLDSASAQLEALPTGTLAALLSTHYAPLANAATWLTNLEHSLRRELFFSDEVAEQIAAHTGTAENAGGAA